MDRIVLFFFNSPMTFNLVCWSAIIGQYTFSISGSPYCSFLREQGGL